MKLGQRVRLGGNTYEITNVRSNGCLAMRPWKPGMVTHGTSYTLDETVRVVGYSKPYTGKIISLEPLRALVTSEGKFQGKQVACQRIRKVR
jgi:hypothetical protein